ncbi:MAG: hypothetical protein AB7G12_12715 [Thermoanaerobaculia bacterium]
MTESVRILREKVKAPVEELDYGVDFTPVLRTGETIASITSITSTPAEDAELEGRLVIDDGDEHVAPAINSATFLNDEGTTVALSKGVIFWVLGGIDGVVYRINVRVVTSLGRKWKAVCILRIDDGDL